MSTIIKFFKELFANFETDHNKNEYKKANELGVAVAIAMENEKGNKTPEVGPYVEHPLHKDAVKKNIKFITSYTKSASNRNKAITIAFGDSLLDLSRDRLSSIKTDFNFSLSGSVSHHMIQMARELQKYLLPCNVKYIVIGCLLGNALLQYQNVDASIAEAINALNGLRALYPNVKIIVYGLPPVYNKWVNTHAIQCEVKIWEWTVRDVDSVFIPLQKFAGFLGIFPKVELSSDGVHFTPKGIYEFDDLIERAKRAKRGTIVN